MNNDHHQLGMQENSCKTDTIYSKLISLLLFFLIVYLYSFSSLNYLLVCPKRLGYQGTHIKYLDLSHNMISFIPEEITLLKGLEYFEVSNNHLSELPVRLPFLYISHNIL